MGKWEVKKKGGQRFTMLSRGKQFYADNYRFDIKPQSKKIINIIKDHSRNQKLRANHAIVT